MESGNTAQTVPTELYPLPGLFVVLMESLRKGQARPGVCTPIKETRPSL